MRSPFQKALPKTAPSLRWLSAPGLTCGWLLGLSCLLWHSTLGQTLSPQKALGQYQQFIWQDQHGLPSNTVNAILRTRDGYLWLGTEDGAVRFDGVRFTVFDRNNTPEMKNQGIAALLEDRAGQLWLGTNGGGLLSRTPEGRWTRLTGLSSERVTCLLEDRAGDLWIGTYNGGLNRYHAGHFTTFTTADGLPDNYIWALTEARDGSLWIGTNSGLTRFHEGRFVTYSAREGLGPGGVRALCWDQTQTLWVGLDGGGLSQFRDGRFTRLGRKEGLRHEIVRTLHADGAGNLWVGTSGGGLFRYHDGGFDAEAIQEGVFIFALYQDAEGNLWFGTRGGGLGLLREARFSVYAVQDGLAHDRVRAIYEDVAGNLWFGVFAGLSRFRDGQFTSWTTKDGLAESPVEAIGADPAGNLWFGSGERLCTLRGERLSCAALDDVARGGITAVRGDRAGNLWVGTRFGGLQRLREGRHTTWKKSDGLADDFVENLFEDRAGNLWIGTRGGISQWRDERLTTYTTRDGLAGNRVLGFYEDQRGSLWIGTIGDGLSRFRDGKFANITVKDGLFDNIVFQILSDTDDDSGSLWMTCNKGIYRVSWQELNDFAEGRVKAVHSFAYGVTDGMLSRECNGGAPGGWRTRDGRLWFPTIKGAVVIDPRKRNDQPPLVALEQVLLDRVALPLGRQVEIRPGQENLEVQYTALSWNRPQQISFKYQLEGRDHTWVEAGTRRAAYYAYLPPGAYTFRVIADNGDGKWNLTGQSLRVVVHPHFYQTWWFVALVTGGIGGVALLGFRLRVRQLERAHALQEAFSRRLMESQEQERKRIAAELHDSLGQNLLVIKNRAALAKLTSADLPAAFQQLDQIADSTTHAIQEVRQIAYNLRPHHLDNIGLTRSLEELLRRVEETTGLSISYEIAPLDGAFPKEAEINFYRIVQEAVSNIVKHAQATRAGVEVERQPERLLLTIRDNGRGFVVQEPGEQRGFGLTGMAERARILGGTYRVESEPGKGTTVVVELPLL